MFTPTLCNTFSGCSLFNVLHAILEIHALYVKHFNIMRRHEVVVEHNEVQFSVCNVAKACDVCNVPM